MNTNLHFSSNKQDWTTPSEFYNNLNKEFYFTLDPCCYKETALCKNYYTLQEDGLKQSWEGHRVFCNPPYGKEIKKWVEKCYIESKKENTLVVLLIPARTDTTYFHDYIYKPENEIRFIKGRLKFGGCKNPAPFPSMVVIFNKNKKKICK